MVVAAVLMVALPAMAQEQREDEAWSQYRLSFKLLAAGEIQAARTALDRLSGAHPGHPAAALASARLGDLNGTIADVGEVPLEPGQEPTARLARAELGFWMTLNGLTFASLGCEVAECDNSRVQAGVAMLGAGGGLAASLFFTRDGITPGHTLLLDSSVAWGTWNSLFLVDNVDGDSQKIAGSVMAGQAVGLAAGFGLWEVWQPTDGDVALTNTAGIWTTVVGLLGHGVLDTEPKLETIVAIGDAGLVAGALASQYVKMSRGRTLLIDAGGIIGALAGGLITVIAEPDNTTAAFIPPTLGVIGGLGLATYMTRDWDVPDPPASAGLILQPMGKGGWGASVHFTLD
jgi:hypothetical protein